MKTLTLAAASALVLIAAAVTPAEAKGCIKGAVVGGVAGHLAHHGVLGAVGGCVSDTTWRQSSRKPQYSRTMSHRLLNNVVWYLPVPAAWGFTHEPAPSR